MDTASPICSRHSRCQGRIRSRVWGYGTTDPLEEMLGAGYMRGGASILRPGELIYVRTCPRGDAASGRAGGARRSGATTGGRPWEPAARMALLIAVGWERNAMRLRLVQDFGRPPGSRNKKAAFPSLRTGYR